MEKFLGWSEQDLRVAITDYKRWLNWSRNLITTVEGLKVWDGAREQRMERLLADAQAELEKSHNKNK